MLCSHSLCQKLVDAISYTNSLTGRSILIDSGRIDVTILLEEEHGQIQIDMPTLRVALDQD